MATNGTNPKRNTKRRRIAQEQADARLSIPASIFSEESARRIIDDWLVPVLVERFIRRKETSSKSDERKA
jgi:hypothetical protein